MAEVLAGWLTSAIVGIAKDKQASAIKDQTNLLWNFGDDLEDMNSVLESISAALQDAERRSVNERLVQLWLKRLKHASIDITDMLEDYQDTSERLTAKISIERVGYIRSGAGVRATPALVRRQLSGKSNRTSVHSHSMDIDSWGPRKIKISLSDPRSQFTLPHGLVRIDGKKPGVLSCVPVARKRIAVANRMKSIREDLRKINKDFRDFNFSVGGTSISVEQHDDACETSFT